MNRRGFISSIFGLAATVAATAKRVAAQPHSSPDIIYVTVGGMIVDCPELPNQVTEEILAKHGIRKYDHFYILPGPLMGIYWPQVNGGLWQSKVDLMLAHAKDDISVWMYPVRASNENVKTKQAPSIEGAISKFPNKDGWHVVLLDGGRYPQS